MRLLVDFVWENPEAPEGDSSWIWGRDPRSGTPGGPARRYRRLRRSSPSARAAGDRTANMGLCSHTHHEHLPDDARKVQADLDAALADKDSGR